MSSSDTASEATVCPVDHKSREAWLKNARQDQQHPHTQQQKSLNPHKPQVPLSPDTLSSNTSSSCDSSSMDQSTITPPTPSPRFTSSRLSTHREISSIPRAPPSPSSSTTSAPETQSFNAETPISTQTPSSSNWVYPSEAQFFSALQRKHGTSGTSARESDMKSIIPIHNAVNERTWKDILEWERVWGGIARGEAGQNNAEPKLVSFSGDASKLTPRARVFGWMGYTRPFDRHDWVVRRGDREVGYVIDYYTGKGGKGIYLDTRPKIDTLEGCRMRLSKFFGSLFR